MPAYRPAMRLLSLLAITATTACGQSRTKKSPEPLVAEGNADALGGEAATYLVGVYVDGEEGRAFYPLGAAFAVENRLLATSAQMVLAVTHLSSHTTVRRVSALQANTGVEVPLLQAAVHPSYRDSQRSPDLALLVTRTPVRSLLRLASQDELAKLRKGASLTQLGFAAEDARLAAGKTWTELDVPISALISGHVNALENFDPRAPVQPSDIKSVDLIRHSLGKGLGVNGAPILHNGQVVGVSQVTYTTTSTVHPDEASLELGAESSAGSVGFGLLAHHLKHLLDAYSAGVLPASSMHALPPTQDRPEHAQAPDPQPDAGILDTFAYSRLSQTAN